jgi:hypothetical protein
MNSYPFQVIAAFAGSLHFYRQRLMENIFRLGGSGRTYTSFKSNMEAG